MIEFAGVHAHRIEVLDRADDDAIVVFVAHHLHLVFLPAQHQFLDQYLARRRSIDSAFDDLDEFRLVVRDAAAGAAKRERRPDDGGQADILERFERLNERLDLVRARRGKPDLGHRLAEQLAVFCLVDRGGGGADHFDVELVQNAHAPQRQRGVERRLPAHGRQQREPAGNCVALLGDDLGDDFRRDRLDVGRVRQIRIGHDGRRIGIDQHDAIALGLEGLAGLRAGIVELAGLADNNRPCADDEDRGDVGPSGHRFRASSGHKKRARNRASFGQRRARPCAQRCLDEKARAGKGFSGGARARCWRDRRGLWKTAAGLSACPHCFASSPRAFASGLKFGDVTAR